MVLRMLQNECIVNLMIITDVMCFTVSGHVFVCQGYQSGLCLEYDFPISILNSFS